MSKSEERIILRQEKFSKVIDFSDLTHIDGSYYSYNSDRTIDKTASNSISDRTSLTSTCFELATELFTLEHIQDLCKSDNDFVVDIGCGEPALFSLMSNSMIFPNYIGVDIRPDPLKNYGNNSNCIVIESDITKDRFIKENSIKVVILSEVLEHLTEDNGKEVIRSIHKILKDDGTLLLTTPINPKSNNVDMDAEFKKWDHVTYYEYDKLIDLLNDLGFEVEFYAFNKFIGRRKTYRNVMSSFINKYGDVGREIWDHISNVWSKRVASTILASYAGDQMGHIQIVARKITE